MKTKNNATTPSSTAAQSAHKPYKLGVTFSGGGARGFAHAGAYGDLAAYIAALSIDTGQIQIGKILFLPPENSGKKKGGFLRRSKEGESFSPQIARVRDGHVIMEPCTKDLF